MTVEKQAPAHPTWEAKSEAWKFLPPHVLQAFTEGWCDQNGVSDLEDRVTLNDFAAELYDYLEHGIKALMNPVSGLNVEKPSIKDMAEADAFQKLFDDIRQLWNEMGAPGTYVGSTSARTDQEHVDQFADIIVRTRDSFQEALPIETQMHGVFILNSSDAICTTGHTPQAQKRALLISMLLSAIPGIFVTLKMAEAAMRGRNTLDPEAVAIIQNAELIEEAREAIGHDEGS